MLRTLLFGWAALGGCKDEEPCPPAEQPIDVHYVDNPWAWFEHLAPADRGSPLFVDLDGDGAVDLVEATSAGVLWYPGSGGVFGAPELVGIAEAVDLVRVGDMDGDGDLDLLLADGAGTWLLLQDAEVGWTPAEVEADLAAADVVLWDADGDGFVDILALHDSGLSLLLNNGGGRFRQVAGALDVELSAGALAVADLDGDGNMDLFVAGDLDSDRLYLGDGTGAFLLASADALPAAEVPASRAVAVADFDGDGSRDLFVACDGQDRLLLNDGSGRFSDESPFSLGVESSDAIAAAATDLDLDGFDDLVVAGWDGPLRLLHNDGTARFFDWSGRFAGAVQTAWATGLAVRDVDGDGDPDLFVGRGDLRLPWVLESWSPETLDDADGDGVPDELDVCPEVSDPEQEDSDGQPFYCTGSADCASATGCELLAGVSQVYLWCASTGASWTDAQAACAARGASLLTISSQEEADLLLSAGVGDAWIGYSDAVTEGSWRWDSGEVSTWAEWAEGEPNDSGGDEDCAVIRSADGLLNDAPCSGSFPFVCEASALGVAVDPGDACDTCPTVPDPEQRDTDLDGLGDLCDTE